MGSEAINSTVAGVRSIWVLTDPVAPKSPSKRKAAKREVEKVSNLDAEKWMAFQTDCGKGATMDFFLVPDKDVCFIVK